MGSAKFMSMLNDRTWLCESFEPMRRSSYFCNVLFSAQLD